MLFKANPCHEKKYYKLLWEQTTYPDVSLICLQIYNNSINGFILIQCSLIDQLVGNPGWCRHTDHSDRHKSGVRLLVQTWLVITHHDSTLWTKDSLHFSLRTLKKASVCSDTYIIAFPEIYLSRASMGYIRFVPYLTVKQEHNKARNIHTVFNWKILKCTSTLPRNHMYKITFHSITIRGASLWQ